MSSEPLNRYEKHSPYFTKDGEAETRMLVEENLAYTKAYLEIAGFRE